MKFCTLTVVAFATAIGTLAACTGPTRAADLQAIPYPVKAKPRVLLTYAGSGMYYGLHTFADNEKIDLSGVAPAGGGGGVLSGLGGTFAVGAAVGGTAGWMWGDRTSWKAIEFMGSWRNIGTAALLQDPNTGAVTQGASSSTWGFTQRFKFGGPLASVMNLLPNLSTVFPVLPSAVFPGSVASTTHPYLFGALHEDNLKGSFGNASGSSWKIKGGFGVGAMTQLTSGVVMDVWAEYIPHKTTLDISAQNGTAGSAAVSRETRIGVAAYW